MMIRDRLFRIAALADTLFRGTFPAWAIGIRAREESHQWWQIDGNSIVWTVADSPTLPQFDHIEMSGFELAAIVSYGVDKRGRLRLYRHITWPRLRKWPNVTQASFSYNFSGLTGLQVTLDNRRVRLDRPTSFIFDGILTIRGAVDCLKWERRLFPDADAPVFHEELQITNISINAVSLQIRGTEIQHRVPKKRGYGTCFIVTCSLEPTGEIRLEPGKSVTLLLRYTAIDADAPAATHTATHDGLTSRRELIDKVSDSLVFESSDAELDLAFRLAKLRTSESIFHTKGGLMHGPGGGEYYAALWTNDQCEYVNPYFAWSGYGPGLEQAMNCYRRYAALMDPEGVNPLPTSIIAEGEGIWNGAGDRGDAAMYAQGAGRFLLAAGRRDWIEELLPAIDWCLDWCERHRLEGTGPVASDSDELEGRFPSGAANLATSVLYYDALVSRAHLAHATDDLQQVDMLSAKAEQMANVIEEHFGATVEGFDTYQYFEGCPVLRSWICLPLTVGLHERSAGTLDALFSPYLWTANGLLTAANSDIVWDRSTLFALRGAFAAGATKIAWQKLKEYTHQRLTGAHVPYPSEAYPEGNRRHLSAESGLYCRIFIEGLLGLRPTGLRSFDWAPRLPDSLPRVALRRIAAFGAMNTKTGAGTLDLEVERTADLRLHLLASLTDSNGKALPVFEKTISASETVRVTLPEEH